MTEVVPSFCFFLVTHWQGFFENLSANGVQILIFPKKLGSHESS
jgi:hypothetical protein